MLAELDVVVYLKMNDSMETVAERVFGVLRTAYGPSSGEAPTIEGTGLGFRGLLFANSGDALDPEFEQYAYGLEITSTFWCVELDSVDLEGPLSEYFARQLAFELDIETATDLLLESTEESEIFEIRAYRRNPQYRLDLSPTTPRVFVIETRKYEEAFSDEDWEDDEENADEAEMVADLEREDRV